MHGLMVKLFAVAMLLLPSVSLAGKKKAAPTQEQCEKKRGKKAKAQCLALIPAPPAVEAPSAPALPPVPPVLKEELSECPDARRTFRRGFIDGCMKDKGGELRYSLTWSEVPARVFEEEPTTRACQEYAGLHGYELWAAGKAKCEYLAKQKTPPPEVQRSK